MTSTDQPPRSRRRLLRLWAVVSAAYVVIAAAGSALPLRAAIGRAQAAHARAAEAPPPRVRPPRPDGPLPETPDGPAEILAKAAGGELLLLAGPPLLLLWFGWDVWFALAGFFPALDRASRKRAETPVANQRGR